MSDTAVAAAFVSVSLLSVYLLSPISYLISPYLFSWRKSASSSCNALRPAAAGGSSG